MYIVWLPFSYNKLLCYTLAFFASTFFNIKHSLNPRHYLLLTAILFKIEGEQIKGETFSLKNFLTHESFVSGTFHSCWTADLCTIYLFRKSFYCLVIIGNKSEQQQLLPTREKAKLLNEHVVRPNGLFISFLLDYTKGHNVLCDKKSLFFFGCCLIIARSIVWQLLWIARYCALAIIWYYSVLTWCQQISVISAKFDMILKR